MKANVIKQSHSGSISSAKSVLFMGGVIAVPTDTVYGIACLVDNPKSINRLYDIKQRDVLKAVPVLIGTIEQIEDISSDFPESGRLLARHLWPGALTIIIKKHPELPKELTAFDTVGVRMPNHKWLRQLMEECGPLAVTSANISGDPALAGSNDVLETLGEKIDLLIDGGQCVGGIPSTVVDCTKSPVRILRIGGITKETITHIISENQ